MRSILLLSASGGRRIANISWCVCWLLSACVQSQGNDAYSEANGTSFGLSDLRAVPPGLPGSESVGFVVWENSIKNKDNGKCELLLWEDLKSLLIDRQKLVSDGWATVDTRFRERANDLTYCDNVWPDNRWLAATIFSGSGFLIRTEDVHNLPLRISRDTWPTPEQGYALYGQDDASATIPDEVKQQLDTIREQTNLPWFVTAGHVVRDHAIVQTSTDPNASTFTERFSFHGPLNQPNTNTRKMKVIFGLENVDPQNIVDGNLEIGCDQVFTPIYAVTSIVAASNDTTIPGADFAVLILDRAVSPNHTGLRIDNVENVLDVNAKINAPVRMMGFPFSMLPMQMSEGPIVDIERDSHSFRYALAATGGFSGAPVMTTSDDNSPVALGIHVVGEALTYASSTTPSQTGFFPLHCLRPATDDPAWASQNGRFHGCIHPVLPGQNEAKLIASHACKHITEDGELCFVDKNIFARALNANGCLAFPRLNTAKGMRIGELSSNDCAPSFETFYPKAVSMGFVKSNILSAAFDYLADDLAKAPITLHPH